MVCSNVYSFVRVRLLKNRVFVFMLSVVVRLLWCDNLMVLCVIRIKFGLGIMVFSNSVMRMVNIVVDVVIGSFFLWV